MGLFSRFSRRRRPAGSGGAGGADDGRGRAATMAHLAEFARTRVGVEAYIEPATSVTQTTLILVATSGEWTRRRVPDPEAARDVARRLAIPVYDVTLTGYPAQMRTWNAQQRERDLS